jgi:Smg protein
MVASGRVNTSWDRLNRSMASGCVIKAIKSGYSEAMFDVLVYLYENYWRPDACPDHDRLARKLTAVGFELEEIEEALSWLDGLAESAQAYVGEQSVSSVRVYSEQEQLKLGQRPIGFVNFLESAGVLPPPMREMVLDRASAVSGEQINLEDLKIIVLMVFWSLGEEPDALILDELLVEDEDRLIH